MTVVEMLKFPRIVFFSGCNDFKHTLHLSQDNLSVVGQMPISSKPVPMLSKGLDFGSYASLFFK